MRGLVLIEQQFHNATPEQQDYYELVLKNTNLPSHSHARVKYLYTILLVTHTAFYFS